MDFNKLNYYKTLVEEMNYTRAAQKLFISQPSLTEQIQNLEKELNCQLIVRSKRVISLSDKGMLFYDYCCKALEEYEKIKLELNKKIIKIASIDHSSINKWLQTINQINLSQEEVEYSLDFNPYMDFSKEIESHQYDVLLGYRDDHLLDLNYSYEKITDIAINLYRNEHNTLPNNKNKIKVICFEYGACEDHVLISLLKKYGLSKENLKYVKSIDELLFYANDANTIVAMGNVGRNLEHFIEIDETKKVYNEIGWYYNKGIDIDTVKRLLPYN